MPIESYWVSVHLQPTSSIILDFAKAKHHYSGVVKSHVVQHEYRQ